MTADFKEGRIHTLEQGVKLVKRFRNIVKQYGYVTTLFGSVLLNGSGQDIDIQIVGSVEQTMSPDEIAMTIVKKHAKRILLWNTAEYGKDYTHITIVFITNDDLYVDLGITGVSGESKAKEAFSGEADPE